MTGLPDDVPGYRAIRIGMPRSDAEGRADLEAARATADFPSILVAGPQFGAAREREQGGWEILYLDDVMPQQARDGLAPRFRELAKECADAARRKKYMDAAERLEWEPVNELTVLGDRYRIVRADNFIRSGPAGPEPPRLTDPDPVGDSVHNDPVRGFVVDPAIHTTLAAGRLTIDLLFSVYPAATVPPDVYRDSKHAQYTHPGGVLLPPAFLTAEFVDGHWTPAQGRPSASPSSARHSLAWYLRVWLPYEQDLDEQQRAPYVAAADEFEDSGASVLNFMGRRFRVTRVERLMRIGPDGPEEPRPSDPDPDPPPMVWEQRRREQGIVEPDENAPLTPQQQADHERLNRLIAEAAEREEKRRGKLPRRANYRVNPHRPYSARHRQPAQPAART